MIEKVGFAGDSPLEGAGSELPVPVEIRLRFQAFSGTGPPLGPAFVWISEASPRQYSVDELVKRILVEPARTQPRVIFTAREINHHTASGMLMWQLVSLQQRPR
jgi:hypothetical protein